MTAANQDTAPTKGPWPARPEPLDDVAELARVDAVIAAGPYEATWESLSGYTVPDWFRDAKFGVFLHWGAYTVPAFGNEWYPRHMYVEGTAEYDHHRRTYGPQTEFGYKDFLADFTAERWDPADWADLFHRAGAQFVVPVAEHHDGFAMYETARSRWKTTAIGPHRDVVGELGAAVRDRWMVLGVSSHRAEHWFFMNGGARTPSDVTDPEFVDFYGPAQREETSPNEAWMIDWFLRTVELIDRYRPQVLWFDWWIERPVFKPWLRKLAAYYYNEAARWGREVVIQYKWDAFAPGTAVLDLERGAMDTVHPTVWQNDTSVARTSWSWVPDQQYKTLPELIAELVDVVAKNGVLLLNIGPKSDGTIADEERELLTGIGDWLRVNGQAIYGSVPWAIPAEGPTVQAAGSFIDATERVFGAEDIRFTSQQRYGNERLYATLLAWPEDGVARIRAWGSGSGQLARPIRSVDLLGHDGEVTWTQTEDALEVRLPADRPSAVGAVIRLTPEPAEAGTRLPFDHEL
ncbi:alpha-L-fucosidase [Friedmanniella endophytica]|uniref:alpha-L-fucosidase n=1 Tax=Microlunatus kandeliicorticis TaxID=1759536 RepID=A0A7W3IPW8_9ACTN|nr:alpha-L-fucosidase [Microlunatus kandeliicorticis]MBA8792995.1 alpha-L-fucosidase [Microlunatus kandeliicorticis]